MIFLLSIALLLIALFLFWTIPSEIEKGRRLKAEEGAIREIKFRENSGWYIKNTVKEQRPSQLKESISKIHPENMALIIRKLILEDFPTELGNIKGARELTKRQKLAALLISIGSETSSGLFKYLRKDELKTIVAELKQLEQPDSDQVEAILQEFRDLMVASLERK